MVSLEIPIGNDDGNDALTLKQFFRDKAIKDADENMSKVIDSLLKRLGCREIEILTRFYGMGKEFGVMSERGYIRLRCIERNTAVAILSSFAIFFTAISK